MVYGCVWVFFLSVTASLGGMSALYQIGLSLSLSRCRLRFSPRHFSSYLTLSLLVLVPQTIPLVFFMFLQMVFSCDLFFVQVIEMNVSLRFFFC